MLLLKLLKISTFGQQGYGKFIPPLKTFSALTHKLFHAAAAPFAISIKFTIEEVMDRAFKEQGFFLLHKGLD